MPSAAPAPATLALSSNGCLAGAGYGIVTGLGTPLAANVRRAAQGARRTSQAQLTRRRAMTMRKSGNQDILNRLLRGELAATETYQQALAKVGSEPRAADLRRIHDEHRSAANELRMHIHQHGGKPDQHSGGWGAWAKTVEGAAKIFGDASAVKALKEGEEHGVKDYEAALADANLPGDCKELIRNHLLPQTRSHIPVLDGFLSARS
jgi:uncharacterized protein (TIGR02284 family)